MTLACLFPLGAKLARGGAGDRDAARRLNQPENRSSADLGSHAKIGATERTTSQSYRRTTTSIATYSMSRNPKFTSPPQLVRCELRAASYLAQSSPLFRRRIVRSVTSVVSQRIKPPHEGHHSPTKLYHPVDGAALLVREVLLQLEQLSFGH